MALRLAKQAGRTPAEVWAILAEFDAKPGAWDSGALYQVVTGELAGWPEPSERYLREQLDQQQEEKRRQEAEEERLRREAEARHDEYAERLEAEHGMALDALDKDELRAFINSHCGTEAAFLIKHWNKKGCPLPIPAESIMRQPLLEAFAANGVAH